MTEFENNGQAPFPSQDGKNKMESFRLFAETPESADPDMTHCRVPLSAWLSETKTFCKRYFWRLFLLSLIASVLSLFVYSSQWSSRNANPLNSIVSPKSAVSPTRDVRDSGENDVDFFDNDVADPDGQNASVDSEGAAAPNGEKSAVPASSPALLKKLGNYSSVLKICSFFFQLMLLGWVIRTIRQDNPAWRNLRFASWSTFFKAFAALVVFFLLLMAAMVIFLDYLTPLFVKIFHSAAPTVQSFCLLLIVVIFFTKFALAIPLIVDRDFGPFRAMNLSWSFMRSNAGTFICGGIATFLGCFLLAILVSIPLGIFLAGRIDTANSSPEAIQQAIFSTPSLCGAMIAFTVAVSTLISVWTYGFISLFYLMATGQERPGAWARDLEPAAEQDDPNK